MVGQPLSDNLNSLHGMLLVDKPKGMVSKDVSRWLEKSLRCSKRPRLGHVGTLDPLAEGVLPLVFGKATRLQDQLLALRKSYEFTVKFGFESPTLDEEGPSVPKGETAHLTESTLREIAHSLVGDFLQTPPAYAAIKFQGRPLYEYARLGTELELDALKKVVFIERLSLLSFDATESAAKFAIRCSKGTYVRSVAAKISDLANTCGIVTQLVRTEAAGFQLTQTHSLDQIGKKIELQEFQELLIPIESFQLPHWRSPSEEVTKRLLQGQRIAFPSFDCKACFNTLDESPQDFIILSHDGHSLGIGHLKSDNAERTIVSMRRQLT